MPEGPGGGIISSGGGIEIRPAEPSDARGFLSFWRVILAEERFMRGDDVRVTLGEYRRRFRRSWTHEEAHVLALEGGGIVGFVGLSREQNPVTRHVATLGIAVSQDHRRRGIGTSLMGTAMAWARSVGVEKLLLSVYPGNDAAISLYRRLGFVEEGRLSRQSRKSYGYEDEILMALWLGSEPGRVRGVG
jgi:ribosomal protein S18 acetylase RimI-like enzyme